MKAMRAVSGWRAWAIQGALILTALILYVPGITWGLPYATGPDRIYSWGNDELGALGPLAQVYSVVLHGNAEFDPRYPLLPYAIQLLFMLPYLAWLWLTGGLSSFSVSYPYGLTDPVTSLARLALFGRVSTLVMVSSVPAIAYFTARTLWDRRTAVLAGFLVLLLYPMFYYSRTSNVDGPSLFWTSLGLLTFAICLRQGLTLRRAILFGVASALAVAAKDQNYAIFVTAGIVLAAQRLASGESDFRTPVEKFRPLLAALLVALPVYAVASGLAFNPHRFAEHVTFILHGSGTDRHGYFSNPATPGGYLRLLQSTMKHVGDLLGLPMLVAAVIGVGIAGARNRTALLWALPAAGLLAGVIIPVRFVLLRFLIPVGYMLGLFAAYALAHQLAERGLPNSQRRWLSRTAGWLGLAGVAGWSLLRGADLTYQMRFDSRRDLAEWIQGNARPGDRIGYYDPPEKLPHLSSSLSTVYAPYRRGLVEPRVAWPEFVLVIPQQASESVHEGALAPERFEQLNSGALGYELVYSGRTQSLFGRSPISWVNPHVRAYVRQDVLHRIERNQIRD